MHIIVWAIVLAAFWLLLSGFFLPLILAFGVISVALVVWVLVRMDKEDETPVSLEVGPKKLSYFVWLVGQIVLSSIDVAKTVWRSPGQTRPALRELSIKHLQEKGRVLYANSITLTPGTLSVDLNKDTVTVHALNADSLTDLEGGDMEQRVAKTEKPGSSE